MHTKTHHAIIGPVKIKDGLFLGDQYTSQDLEFVVKNKISHIINCAGKQLHNHWENIGITYFTLWWMESDHQQLFDPKDEIVNDSYVFIEEALAQGQSVLVLSVRGLNRSCCILSAYLMKKYRWTLYKTLEYLHSRKPTFEIRTNFYNQLVALENKLTKNGYGPITQGWSITDNNANDIKNIESDDEIILTNTFLNSKHSPVVDYCNSDFNKESKTTTKVTFLLRNNNDELRAKSTKMEKINSVKSIMKGSTKVLYIKSGFSNNKLAEGVYLQKDDNNNKPSILKENFDENGHNKGIRTTTSSLLHYSSSVKTIHYDLDNEDQDIITNNHIEEINMMSSSLTTAATTKDYANKDMFDKANKGDMIFDNSNNQKKDRYIDINRNLKTKVKRKIYNFRQSDQQQQPQSNRIRITSSSSSSSLSTSDGTYKTTKSVNASSASVTTSSLVSKINKDYQESMMSSTEKKFGVEEEDISTKNDIMNYDNMDTHDAWGQKDLEFTRQKINSPRNPNSFCKIQSQSLNPCMNGTFPRFQAKSSNSENRKPNIEGRPESDPEFKLTNKCRQKVIIKPYISREKIKIMPSSQLIHMTKDGSAMTSKLGNSSRFNKMIDGSFQSYSIRQSSIQSFDHPIENTYLHHDGLSNNVNKFRVRGYSAKCLSSSNKPKWKL